MVIKLLSYWLLSYGIIGFMSQSYFLTHSRREFMFIEIFKAIHLNPEGIICLIAAFLHKTPSGLRKNRCLVFYKHTLPSGI